MGRKLSDYGDASPGEGGGYQSVTEVSPGEGGGLGIKCKNNPGFNQTEKSQFLNYKKTRIKLTRQFVAHT